ncbi:hypothetical protein [Rhizosphaericola mali]|uniref:Yip1 domain-containing protein n=1 Tax=Rhizosphaericola mali TaxID=2545455 RepID=A0A5P2G9Q9_9BACT|nr:hypothetical protein [Rhizosphaericola mali]QES89943.1 hypothetical protein E0W69_015175 [Rhizosphaericola mali]
MTQNKILTPFYYLAGAKTLIIGILFLAITTLLSYFSFCRFDGLIDIHFSKPIYFPFTRFLLDQIIGWLLTCIFFCLGFLFCGAGRWPRAIDLLGTTIFARIPLVIAPLMAFIFPNLIPTNVTPSNLLNIDFGKILMLALISIVGTILHIILLYNAYKVCFNLTGTKLKLSFILIIVLGEILTKIPIIYQLLF